MEVKDYSEFLTAAQLKIEEQAWKESAPYSSLWYAGAVNTYLLEHPECHSVLEFGCGTGLVPLHLPMAVQYVGVDKNKLCVERARAKNDHSRTFLWSDIRVCPYMSASIVCAFAFLKHFQLHEWNTVFRIFIEAAPVAIFTLPMTDAPRSVEDNTKPFTHVTISHTRLNGQLELHNRVIESARYSKKTQETIFVCKKRDHRS